MERLTEFHNGIWEMSVKAVENGYDRYSVFSKLAEYENLNLTPQQLTEIDKLYLEKCEEVNRLNKELEEYRQLKEQGRLIELLCKVGDTVYYARKCIAPSCKECKGFLRVDNCLCEYKGRIFEQQFSLRHIYAFGESVFLTREEAEKELAERQENND